MFLLNLCHYLPGNQHFLLSGLNRYKTRTDHNPKITREKRIRKKVAGGPGPDLTGA